MEIDLQKPLLPYVEVEDDIYNVVYEGISMICFNCGCFGHAKAACPHQKPPIPEEANNVEPGAGSSNGEKTPNVPSDMDITVGPN